MGKDTDRRLKVMVLLPTLEVGGAEHSLALLIERLDRTRFAPELALVYESDRHYRVPADVPVHMIADQARELEPEAENVAESATPLEPQPEPNLAPPRLVTALPDDLAEEHADAIAWLDAMAIRFGELVERERPDIVLAGMLYTSMMATLARPLMPENTRLLLRIDAPPSAVLAGPHEGLYRYLVASTFDRADAYMPVSEGVAADLIATLGIDGHNVFVNHSPIDVESITSLAEEPLEDPLVAPAGPTVLFVGRLEPVKGVEHLIRAFAQVADDTGASCVIVGDGSLRDSLEGLARELGVAWRVHFTGAQRNPYAYMRAADILVVPSLYEGIGRVAIEAMACGCPVIASDVAGDTMRYVLGEEECGIIVPVGDEPALAAAIAELLNDVPRRRALALCGPKRALDFDVAHAVARTEALLSSLAR